jgi:tetratricopeptide (TPR) repeat protein
MPVLSLRSDIASLWILALVIVVLVLAAMFRKAIQKRLEIGGVRVSRGDTSVEIEPAPQSNTDVSPSLSPPPQDEDRQALDPGMDVTDDTVIEADGEESKSTWLDVLNLLGTGELEGALGAFRELQSEVSNEDEKLRNEVVFAFWRLTRAHDTKAVSDLEKFAEDNRVKSLALRFLAFRKREAGIYDEALALYDQSREAATNEEDRAAATIGGARTLMHLDRRDEAVRRLMEAVSGASTDGEREDYFVEIAEIFKKGGEWLNRALALEKAIEMAPESAARRFDAGYAYSQADREDLALIHYAGTLELNPDDTTARNNIGVAYENLDMPIKAVESYRRASDAGETLASANLGNRFLNAGFVKEARAILEPSVSVPEAHPNVATNLASTIRRAEQEDEREEKVQSEAIQDRDFLRRYADAYLVARDSPDLSGTWSGNGSQLAIVQQGASFVASFKTGEKEARYEGTITNRALEIVYSVEEWNVLRQPSVKEFVTKGSGRGFVDGDCITISVQEGSTRRTERFERLSE